MLVEDDERFRERLAQRADRARLRGARRGVGGRRAGGGATRRVPSWRVVDLKLPGGSGLDVVRGLHAIDPTTRIVVLTGYGSIATALESVKLARRTTSPSRWTPTRCWRRSRAGTGTPEPPTVGVPSLARVEWEHIQRVLNDCDGNVSQAARLLGIHRRSLQRKLSKFPTAR